MYKNNAKLIRTAKGMTLKEVVEEVNNRLPQANFTIDMLTRFENNKGSWPAPDVLEQLSSIYGCTVPELLGFTDAAPPCPIKPIETNYKWDNAYATKRIIADYLANNSTPENMSDIREQLRYAFVNYSKQINCSIVKLVIALLGKPDAGKTKILTAILGKNILKSRYLATTAAIIHIKHINDKPSFMEHNNVLVLNEDAFDTWSPINAADAEWCEKNCKKMGDYELIDTYGNHPEKEGSKDESAEVGAIIIYTDSDILKICDFVDMPGFAPYTTYDPEYDQAESRDTLLNKKASNRADAYIYMSAANQFMDGQDIVMAKAIMKQLPALEKKDKNNISPLGNIFFLASHAACVDHGNVDTLDRICDGKAQVIWELIRKHPCINDRKEITGYDYDYDTFRRRFFTSEIESDKLTNDFLNDLKAFIENFATARQLEVKQQSYTSRELWIKECDSVIKGQEDILTEHGVLKNYLESIDVDAKIKEFEKSRKNIINSINDVKTDMESYISFTYNKVINQEHILDIIERDELKKNNKDMEKLMSILCSELENATTQRLKDKTDKVNNEIEMFLKDFESAAFKSNIQANINSDSPLFSFNAERAFASGISGLAALGALSAWAATCGNLGGYVIVAKIVSALAAAGIHVGGTAAAISAVSALGGPVVFGIALSAIVATSALIALGGTWKKSIGNKIVKEFNKKEVLKILTDASEKYWNETIEAFEKGADSVIETWKSDFENLKNTVETFNEESINNTINELNDFKFSISELYDTLKEN